MTKRELKRFRRQVGIATSCSKTLNKVLCDAGISAADLNAPDGAVEALKTARTSVKRIRRNLDLALNRLAEVRPSGHEQTSRPKQPKSLFHFLAWKGGLRPDPELRVLFDTRNPFVPRYGKLIRNSGGMSLDTAREACIEEGFLQDRESNAPSINDLLELIAAEASGNKQYRIHEAIDAWELSRAEALSSLETTP